MPERDFAVVARANAGPDGTNCTRRWSVGRCNLPGGDRPRPAVAPYDQARIRELVGSYEIDAMTLIIGTDGARLRLEVRIKPEIRTAADKELPPDHAPFEFGLLPGDAEEYVITSGGMKGLRGFHPRPALAVAGVDLAGRLFTRVATASP